MDIQQIFKSAGGSVSLGTTRIISPGTPWKFNRFLRALEEACYQSGNPMKIQQILRVLEEVCL
jgi:hypothetical protein